MNLNHRPPPLYSEPPRAVCPVCGHQSYSAGGIHPQCSVHKADEARMKRIKRNKKNALAAADVVELSPWQRICPRCKIVVHIRKKTCACGYAFPTGRPPLAK